MCHVASSSTNTSQEGSGHEFNGGGGQDGSGHEYNIVGGQEGSGQEGGSQDPQLSHQQKEKLQVIVSALDSAAEVSLIIRIVRFFPGNSVFADSD